MGDVLNLDSLRTFLDQACILTLGKPEQADAHSDDPFASSTWLEAQWDVRRHTFFPHLPCFFV